MFSDGRSKLQLILNIEEYEYLSGPHSDVGVKVYVKERLPIGWKSDIMRFYFVIISRSWMRTNDQYRQSPFQKKDVALTVLEFLL